MKAGFANSDGTFSILFGYYNRNHKQELDIPVGPDNQIEPGGPDQGQPTHFLTGRQWGVFTVTVPKDFGTKKLTWTLTANGTTTAIPASLIRCGSCRRSRTPPATRRRLSASRSRSVRAGSARPERGAGNHGDEATPVTLVGRR